MKNDSYKCPDFFVIRTPRLPFERVFAFASTDNADIRGETGFRSEYQRSFRNIKSLLKNGAVKEALWLASPNLHDRIEQSDELSEKLRNSVYRYLARMGFRSTPFGMFAGCGIGKFQDKFQKMNIGQSREWRRTRPDMEVIYKIVDLALDDVRIRHSIKYIANSSLYLLGDRYRYAAAKSGAGSLHYELTAVEPTEYLVELVKLAQDEVSFGNLLETLCSLEPGVEPADASAYIDELIESQLLMPSIIPVATETAPAKRLLHEIEGFPAARSIAELLTDIVALCDEADKSDPKTDVTEIYLRMVDVLKAHGIKQNHKKVVQVDFMREPTDVRLPKRIAGDLFEAVDFVSRLLSGNKDPLLTRFCQRFHSRYEDQEIPLVEALDDDIGIGFEDTAQSFAANEPLLNGINFDQAVHHGKGSIDWHPSYSTLLRLVCNANEQRNSEIHLDDTLFKDTRDEDADPLPAAFSVTASICYGSKTGGERPVVLLKTASGPSGMHVLGRFCYEDAALSPLVQQHVTMEENCDTDALFAEIVHMPAGRIGNVMLRPALYSYEIPFLGRSSLPKERHIPITDLMVSVRDSSVILRSRRLNKRVIPRLSNAHNFRAPWNVRLYKFLCLLQQQHVRGGVMWSWGPLASLPHLPRILYKNVILAPEQWNLNATEIREIAGTESRDILGVQRRIKDLDVPRFVTVSEGDQELPFDLYDPISLSAFREFMRKKRGLALKEMLPFPPKSGVEASAGHYSNEIIIPFVRSKVM